MAYRIVSETNACTFLWNIQNFPFWLRKGERIISPTFIDNALENTKWSLRVYPMGEKYENFVSLFLHRESDCCGPDTIETNYHLAFLDEDGSFLTEKSNREGTFMKGTSKGFQKFEERERLIVTEKESFLSGDTLRVQCSIRKKDVSCDSQEMPQYLTALTVFKVNRVSFIWRIEKFSFHKSGLRNNVKDNLIEFHLLLNNGRDFEKKITIDVISLDKSIKYFSFKTSIMDSEGKKEDCGKYEYFVEDLKKGILSAPLFTKKLEENKNQYLPNNVLSLFCEYDSTDGNVLYELLTDGRISPNRMNVAVKNSKEHVEKEKPQDMPVLVDDLKSMYNNRIFCDTELRTPTQAFQAHKSILSARSPVFMSMFTNDMKERNSGHIDITDLEEVTVRQMLVYLYTDSLEEMQLESACKLYMAADKYDILSMKRRCSSFMKENLCPNKACEILELADLYQDDDLKNSVQDYILEHDREVFGSREWKNFMDCNSKLAANVMYRKIFPS
ncbi:unnamed protein product [Larinioides sclopetarius]|uniref:Speckle-type POZ protein n=1 Tax=Larinioides sclopetarius TaxID=280406 RepID=A0AAV2BHL1_9ARAC